MSIYQNILVTNDDGIYSPGIFALWSAMKELGTVTVVAPDTGKSAVGHAITISDPIRIQKCNRHDGFEGYSVDGTPADCVKIAVNALCDRTPDIVVSGINSGANVGNTPPAIVRIPLSLVRFKRDIPDLHKSSVALKAIKSGLKVFTFSTQSS